MAAKYRFQRTMLFHAAQRGQQFDGLDMHPMRAIELTQALIGHRAPKLLNRA